MKLDQLYRRLSCSFALPDDTRAASIQAQPHGSPNGYNKAGRAAWIEVTSEDGFQTAQDR